MQKQYNWQIQQKLTKELAQLRKGSGLTPAQLRRKVAIRTFVARLSNTPPASLTESQVYAFLVNEIDHIIDPKGREALKNALAIDQSTASTLSSRRHSLAKQLNKHPDTIERYENMGLAELATRLNDPLTTTPLFTAPMPTVSYTQHLEEQVAQARAATILNLSGLLSLRQGADELVRYLESLHKPYLNTSITISFRPSIRGVNWYRMDVQFIFQGRRDTFRMAMVTTNEDGERLMKQGLIDEFQKLNESTDTIREMRAVINNSSFRMQHRHTGKQKMLRFHELTEEHTSQLLQSSGPFIGQCRLIEVTIPAQWQDDDILYRYDTTINLRDDIHYAYWYAPSMMFVKKLTFDYTQFPDADKWQFVALPFLGHIAGDVFNRKERSFTLYPNSWIMPGHGVGLMWEHRFDI